MELTTILSGTGIMMSILLAAMIDKAEGFSMWSAIVGAVFMYCVIDIAKAIIYDFKHNSVSM